MEEEKVGGGAWRKRLEEVWWSLGRILFFLSFFSHIFGSFKKMKLTYLYSFKL